MEEKAPTLKFYLSAANKNNLEQRTEKKLSDVENFTTSIINTKEMIPCFKDKNPNSKMIYKNLKTLTSKLQSVDTTVNFGATTKSVTFSVTGVSLMVVPISAGFACAPSLGDKV